MTAEANPFRAAPVDAPRHGFLRWGIEGLRAAFLLSPRVGAAEPTPVQVAGWVGVVAAIELALDRLDIDGPAVFDVAGWLAPWWATAFMVLVGWWAVRNRLAAWFTLWTTAMLPPTLLALGLGVVFARDLMPPAWFEVAQWRVIATAGPLVWALFVTARLAIRLGAARWRAVLLTLSLLGATLVSAIFLDARAWAPEAEPDAQAEAAASSLQLTPATFERQQALWRDAVDSLAPERAGVIDVYGIVFSPYASEDVFLREGRLARRTLEDRFDAAGRVLQLANHPETAEEFAWATPENLERAIDAIGAVMDRERDLLVVYMTSHGAKNFRLEASLDPMTIEPVSPGALRNALDRSAIKHRVIAISACYSGGWVAPLESPTTLVMTAADAEHTSYGCGTQSELTFFGRALWDEQLKTQTRSFEKAFAAMVPVIKQREEAAGKPDGFSNPQLSVGKELTAVLRALEQRLEAPAAGPMSMASTPATASAPAAAPAATR